MTCKRSHWLSIPNEENCWKKKNRIGVQIEDSWSFSTQLTEFYFDKVESASFNWGKKVCKASMKPEEIVDGDTIPKRRISNFSLFSWSAPCDSILWEESLLSDFKISCPSWRISSLATMKWCLTNSWKRMGGSLMNERIVWREKSNARSL